MNKENPKGHGGSAFIWGLIIGALIATLLTTKRGRRILRELSEVAFDLLETFIEERASKTQNASSPRQKISDEIEEVAQDLESEITEVETKDESEEKPDIEEFTKVDIEEKPTTNGHGIKKKRLFRGISKK